MFDSTLRIRHSSYLPHWTKAGAIYHVRVRLCDSVPQTTLKEWKAEREKAMQRTHKDKRECTKAENERISFLFSKKVEQFLDAGYGACWLKRDDIASMVSDTLHFFNNDRYKLYAWTIMPNHIHVVVQPLTKDLDEILHSWKTYTANSANRTLKRKGAFWQREYFDHLIRNEEYLEHTIEYVWKNSEEARLKDWKWRWKLEE